MIERSILAKQVLATHQGLGQRILAAWLKANLDAAKALGFEDVSASEVENPVGEREQYFWNQQIDRLIKRGFHAALEMSEAEYRASMPGFQAQPEQFKGRFTKPLLVDPRPDLQSQLRLFNVYTHEITEAELTKVALAEHLRSSVNDRPYQIWIRVNGQYRSTSKFEWDEAGINIIEALAVVREISGIFKQMDPEGLASLKSIESRILNAESQDAWILSLRKDRQYDHLYLNRDTASYNSPITKGKLYST